MKKLILGLLVLFLVLSCASPQKSVKTPKQTKYPTWFITPQNAVIGYGPVYFIKESGVKEATKSAVDNFCEIVSLLRDGDSDLYPIYKRA